MTETRPAATIRASTLWPIILTSVLALVHLVFPSRVWIALLWMVGGITALGYYWALQMAQGVSCDRTLLYGWVQVGDRMGEQFRLTNTSRLPVLWAEIDDKSDLPGYAAGRIATCPPHSTTDWTSEKECTRRGLYTLGPWSLRTGDPFGLFSMTVDHPETTAIIVYPPVVHLPEITLPRGQVAGRSRARRRATEARIDASQTRFYQPNDPLRLIHWPSTAHRGDLIVKEPNTEISGDLWIILDLDRRVQAGTDQESTEEYGVILAASLAERTLRQNRAVGLAAYGTTLTFVSPSRGTSHMWRLLQALATVRAGGSLSLAEVLRGMKENLRRGATLLAITASCEPGWVNELLPLTRLGTAPTVVLLDPDSFSPSTLASPETKSPHPGPRAQAMRELLSDASVTTHIIRQGFPFRHVVPPQRRGHWEFKVTPMGRAVVVSRPEEAR